jgi:hypothetical protein
MLVALDLSAAFYTVDHGILCDVLQHNYGIQDTSLAWIISYLKNRKLQVQVNDMTSTIKQFNYSVPEGSCLGPILFNAYASTIIDCIDSEQDLGGYADDHYIKDSFMPSVCGAEINCVKRVEDTLCKIKDWMSANILKMNATKTEATLFGSQRMLSKVNIQSINVAGENVPLSKQMKYLGVWLDETLSLKQHIRTKCKTAINNIRCITKIRKCIDTETAKLLAVALVLSHLDYANSILAGLPDRSIALLQRVHNWAAKMVLLRSKYDSSTAALKELHWLPVRERIDFKILCLVFKCLHNIGPPYLAKLLVYKSYNRTTRFATMSIQTLIVPQTTKVTFAARSFSVYGPMLWNTLPDNIRVIDSLVHFKKEIKTMLFRRAFETM